MNFIRGGELKKHLTESKRIDEDHARFYVIQIALALGKLHSKNVVHRDLKPENILVGEDGYIRVTDFGLAKILEGNEFANSFCGTQEYMAPEILNEVPYSFAVDWWALGILAYEMIVGFTPFYTGAANKGKMVNLIRRRSVHFPDPQRHTIEMSDECKDFISRLLDKDANTRLGSQNDIQEILDHPWLSKSDCNEILNKTVEAPMKPVLSNDPLDVSCFDNSSSTRETEILAKKSIEDVINNQYQF